MFDLFNPEEARQKRIQELENKNLLLDLEVAALLKEQNVTEEQLTRYLSMKEAFSDEQWETLVAERKKLDDKLQHDLSLIQKKRMKNKERVQQHWIFAK